MPQSWNVELARAAEVRVCYYMSIGSSREFMWRKAHAAVLAVEKEIRQVGTGRIVNMPRLREVTAQQELEAIVRGERLVEPPEMAAAAAAPAAERDFERHPYLKRMEYRGGGYAILMALHERSTQLGARQFMFKAELARAAQRFCDVSMLSTEGWGRSSSCGWASHRSLVAHRLVVSGRGATSGPGREEFRLTDDGKSFVEAMLRKWPHAKECPTPAGPAAAPLAAAARSRSPRRVCAAPTPLSGLRRQAGQQCLRFEPAIATEAGRRQLQRSETSTSAGSSDLVQTAAIEISSDDEGQNGGSGRGREEPALHAPVAAAAPLVGGDPQGPWLRLLVDDRERLRDIDPRGLLRRVATAVDRRHAVVSQCRLRFGDFMWVWGPWGAIDADCAVRGCVVERKRIADLVGRSASGAHIKQLERLETSKLPHPFLLLEGNQNQAANCPVFDEDLGCTPQDVVRSAEDIEELCAKLLATGSRIGVIATKDAEGTARMLGQLTAWLDWSSTGIGAAPQETLRHFEEAAAARARGRGELAARLREVGVGAAAAEAVRRRFGCADELRAALADCASPEHQRHFFDFVPACHEPGERICAALGLQVPPARSAAASQPRTVHIAACPRLARRLGQAAAPPPEVVLEETLRFHVGVEDKEICCAEIIVLAGSAGEPASRRSLGIFAAVVPAALLVGEVLAAAERLGGGWEGAAHSAATADAAAQSLAARLERRLVGRPRPAGTTRLVILEGLRAAVLAEARAAAAAPEAAAEGAARELPAARARPALLPRLLAAAELAALVLDLRCGWRVRVHETRPSEATPRFLRALARGALQEATLPLAV